MRNRYAALSPYHLVKRPNREEATGTPANRPASDGPSIIVIRVPSIIVLALTALNDITSLRISQKLALHGGQSIVCKVRLDPLAEFCEFDEGFSHLWG